LRNPHSQIVIGEISFYVLKKFGGILEDILEEILEDIWMKFSGK